MIVTKRSLASWVVLLLASSCTGGGAAPAARPAPSPPTAVAADERPVILAVGTSLTAGYGLDDPDEAWPGRLQERLDREGLRYRVVNAGVSGETSAGALTRLDWLLRQKVDVFILETGANDGLRGQDPGSTRANIDAILTRVRALTPAPRIVVVGMEAPPNLGREFVAPFRGMYPELARKHGAALVPFLLEGVAGVPGLNQPDGVHPTAEGHRKLADTVWAVLGPILAAPR
jgi:acyl-CoA thioesterase I